MIEKHCHIYKESRYINTVTYQKNNRVWQAVWFNRDMYMPVSLHDLIEVQKKDLVEGGYIWIWSDDLEPPKTKERQ